MITSMSRRDCNMYMDHHCVGRKAPGLNEPLMFSWECIHETLIMCVTASKVEMQDCLAVNAAQHATPQCSWQC